MKAKKIILKILDNFENYTSQILLAFFVTLLFFQVILRVTIGKTFAWSEELSRFAFVWFVFLGASYATRLGVHNRVVIQLKIFPEKIARYIAASADLIWIMFNGVMIYKSIWLIQSMTEFRYISPTLGWSMAFVYMIFPLSFSLITIRILQVNYLTLVKGVELKDPERVESEEPAV